jgi:hypothetical protein
MSVQRILVEVRRQAVSLVISTLGVWFSVGVFTVSVVVPILGRGAARELVLKPPYPLLIIGGVLIGYTSGLRWTRLCTPWAWVLPGAYLLLGIVSWLHTGYDFADSLQHFFGTGCWPSCQDQYQWTCPLYSSVAFSLGVILYKVRTSAATNDGRTTPPLPPESEQLEPRRRS